MTPDSDDRSTDGRPGDSTSQDRPPPIRRIAEYGAPPAPSLGGGPPRPPPPEGFEQSFLRNPYVLAGFAVAGAIVLAVLVVLIFGGSGNGAGGSEDAGVIIDSLTPGLRSGVVAARSVSTSTVREGPGLEYSPVAELLRNQDVEVVGRNGDGGWYAIFYPPGSQLRGWVPASALRFSGDTAAIPVVSVTPLPRATVIQPTTAPQPTESPTGTATATGTATPSGGLDLMATIVPGTCQVGQRLIVSIRNVSQVPLVSRAITVLVQTGDGAQRTLVATQPANLAPGATIDIDTTYVVQERVVAIVDPQMVLGDANPANNRVDCVVAALPTLPPGVTRTPTPTPTRTPVP